MSTCHSSLFAGPGRLNRVIALFSLAFVFLVPQPGQAQEPLTFFKNYFVNGDHVVRGTSLWRKGVNGQAVVNIPAVGGPGGVPANADILAAFLYIQTAERIQGSGIHRAKFDGVDLGPFRAPGSVEPGSGTFAKALVDWDAATAPCWSVAYPGGRKLQTYRVDVLRFLPIDPLTQKQSLTRTHRLVVPDAGIIFDDHDEGHKEPDKSTLPRAIGASLVVIYRDATKPFSGIVIYDGAYKKGAFATMQQTIKGFYQASANPSAKMTHIVGDGRPFLSERVFLGPTLIATNPFVSALGPKWDNTTFPNALAPAFPLAAGAAEALVTVAPHTLLSDCLTYSGIVFRTTVQDTDTDGLLDIWESSDTTILDPQGQPLPKLKAMGANPNHQDLFAEIGYMYTDPATSPDGAAGVTYGGVLKPHHTHLPTVEALQMVSEAFKNAPVPNPDGFTGINVHFDVGHHYQPPSPPPPGSCANPATWTFACAIVPESVARGGEAIDEFFTMCRSELLYPANEPWVCQFSDHAGDGGYAGTVGWKSGYRFLRDRLIAATPPANLEDCNAPGNDGPGEPCERQFDDNRKHMVHYVFSAHSVGIPQESCLKADGSADVQCQQTNPAFHRPKTYSAIADFPGADVLLALGWFDDAAGHPVGTAYMQGSTMMHEWGHNFELKHGGPTNPKVGGVIVPQIPREPNCKPNYLSVMNYLFQLRGLPDADGVLRMDYSRETIPLLNESGLSENLSLGSQLYRTGWYAPFTPTSNAKAATKHCDGSELTPQEQQDRDNGGGMMRLDATSVLGNIDWNADGDVLDAPSQDINFNGLLEPNLKGSTPETTDWPNIRLQELAARRNVGGLYIDTLGRLAVGPMSLDVGQGDIGQGDIGQGDIGQGDIGQGDIGQGDIGQGDIGQGDIGQGDIGRGLFGGGDLDVGDSDPDTAAELDSTTAAAVEGVVEGEEPTPGPPNALQACLTSDSEVCVTHPDQDPSASTPVNLSWQVPNLAPAKVATYEVYRFEWEGEVFVAPSEENLPDEPIATVSVIPGSTTYFYSDGTAPAGTQLAYFIRGTFGDGERTNRSNFDTITTPEATGTLLAGPFTPLGAEGGNGRGMAFDGTNLFITRTGDSNIYKIPAPLASGGGEVETISVPEGDNRVSFGGPLAWDGSALWTVDYQSSGNVSGTALVLYRVDPSTGGTLSSCNIPAANPEHAALAGLSMPDGLHWAGSELVISGEIAQAGRPTAVAFINPTTCQITSYFEFPADPETCCSGVAFDGATLWHATDGAKTVFQTDMNGVATGISFPTNEVIGFEDLEFDSTTFAGKCAIWGTTAGTPTIAAYQIPCP